MRNDSLADQMKNFKGVKGGSPVVKTDADEARKNFLASLNGDK